MSICDSAMRYRQRTKRALLAALLLLAVAACSAGPDTSPSPELVPIALATSQPQPAGPNSGCPAALLTGTLVAHREWGIAAMAGSGQVERIVWPNGYYGLEIDGRVALLNESNRVVALVGDRIEAGGGYAPYGTDDLFHVCGSLEVVAP
jgi:hypothetical protein